MKRRLTAFILVVATALAVAGSAHADFRHGRMGARPKALGSAFVSLADDANAAYWNPAGLMHAPQASLMLTRSWLYGVSDIQKDYVSATMPGWQGFRFGASWVRLGIDSIYSEDTINFSVARGMAFLEGLSLGVTGKMFLLAAPGYEQYNDPNYNGGDHDFSFDVGAHYDSGDAWTLGAVLYNVTAPTLQLLDNTSDPDPVYREWAAGGSYLFRETLLVTADVRSRDGRTEDIILHGGAEIWFYDALVLRAGLDKGLVAMGVGLQDKHWQADFSLETDKKLGNVYMLSFTLRK